HGGRHRRHDRPHDRRRDRLDPLDGPSYVRRHRPRHRDTPDRVLFRRFAQAHMARQAALNRLPVGAARAAIPFLATFVSPSPAAPRPGQETYWARIMRGQSARLMAEGAEWLQAGAYKQAVDVFAKAVVSSPNEPLTHMMLGVAYYWSGQVDQAMTEYREALRL